MTNCSLIVHTDGGSRGNPGDAGIGVIIQEKGKVIQGFGKFLGTTTNNIAEYTAVEEALMWINHHLSEQQKVNICFYLDSLLVVSQLNGVYKIKNKALSEIIFRIHILEKEIKGVVSYFHVRREQNKLADKMVNMALDKKATVFYNE